MYKRQLLGDGKAFLADLDGDNVPEIFFLYDNWRSSRGVVYAIDGESVRELGEFDAASFYNQDLSFELYQGEEGAILHTQSVLETGVADPREPVTDYYLSLQDGKLTVQEISWIRSKDGDFLEEEDVRSQAEREKETTKILQGRSLAQTILLPKEEIIEDFTDSAVLENTMMALLQDWERET